MQAMSHGKHRWKKMCGLLFCISIIFLGAVCCGQVTPIYYNQTFRPTSGQCQGTNLAPVAGESTLALAVQTGPNITICILRASDGVLLRHFDLATHGDATGQGNGFLYVNERGGKAGDSHALCAIQSSNGITSWCQTQVTNTLSIATAPGLVYATTIGPNTNVGALIALNATTGQIIWSFPLQEDPELNKPPSIAPGQDIVYVSTYNGFQTGTPGSNTATPATNGIQDDTRSVCALQAENGKQLWCHVFPVQSINGIAIDRNAVYVRSINTPPGNQTAFISALHTSDGTVGWQTSLTSAEGFNNIPQFSVAQGIILTNTPKDSASGSEQWLSAWSTSDGKQLWKIPLPDQINSLTSAGKFIYVKTQTKALQAFNIVDGTPAWPAKSFPFPAIDPTTVLIGRTTAYLALNRSTAYESSFLVLALRLKDGTSLWSGTMCARPVQTYATPSPTPTPSEPGTSRCYWTSGRMNTPTSAKLFQLDE